MNTTSTDYVAREAVARLESRLAEQEKRWLDRFEASQRNVDHAAAQLQHRLEGMNEFREAIKDQANRMATKDELKALSGAVRDLQLAKEHLDGRLAMIGSIAGAVAGLLSALIAMWFLI